MKIEDIAPRRLKESPKEEILQMHVRTHQWWSSHFEGNTKESAGGKMSREDVINAHRLLVQEMERRGMKHDSPIDGLPRAQQAKAVETDDLPDEIVIVPQFVSIVGSTARGDKDAGDLDILIRSEQGDDEKKMVIWADSVALPLRKVLDPDKSGALHLILGPTGPHAENVPLYDLVLRRIKGRSQQAEQPGLYLVEPHAEMIWKGEKKAVVKSRHFNVAGKRYILVSDGKDGKAWGMIELHEAKVITLDDFENLRGEHKVTEAERKEWWGDYDKLYYHEIKDFTRYEQPKKVKIPQGVQTFVKDVKLAGDPGEQVKIDLGCGENKANDHVGVDKRPLPGVDVVHNLNRGLPFPDDYADEIRAHHILEHLHDPVFTMGEIWRVLKPDGILDVAVPSTKGEGAFAHPGHTSYWNKTAFAFYCDDELRKECGFLGKFKVEWLEEVERGEAVDVRGRLKAVKEAQRAPLAVSPFYSGPLPKPSQRFTTDFYSIDEMWKGWAESRIGTQP